MKKARRVFSEKEKLSALVSKLAKESKSLSELAEKLKENNHRPYYRNQNLTGVWMWKRKLRLTTLGIDKAHLKNLTIEQERLKSLKSTSQNCNHKLER